MSANNKDTCKCEVESIVFLPCSGASNCGQITNQVAIKLTEEGLANIYCLAGISAHIEGMVESIKAADKIVVIDGCSTDCAKKLIEHIGIKVTNHIRVTDLGIKKKHEFALEINDLTLVADHIKRNVK